MYLKKVKVKKAVFKETVMFAKTLSFNLFQVTAQLLLLSVSTVLGFSKGPPLSTCESKFPHHKHAPAQQGLPPYNINVSPLLYLPGDNLTVTISGSQPFTGFILNAQGTESSIPWPVGTFTQIPNCMYSLNCFFYFLRIIQDSSWEQDIQESNFFFFTMNLR